MNRLQWSVLFGAAGVYMILGLVMRQFGSDCPMGLNWLFGRPLYHSSFSSLPKFERAFSGWTTVLLTVIVVGVVGALRDRDGRGIPLPGVLALLVVAGMLALDGAIILATVYVLTAGLLGVLRFRSSEFRTSGAHWKSTRPADTKGNPSGLPPDDPGGPLSSNSAGRRS